MTETIPAVGAQPRRSSSFPLRGFLFLGLATRFATLPLLVMISVIQLFVYPQAWTDNLLWASILVFLLTRGAGVLSLDYLIERSLSKKRQSST